MQDGAGAGDGAATTAGRRGRRSAGTRMTRKVAGRVYKRYPGEAVVGTDRKWILVHVPEWSRGGWQSFKLFLNDRVASRRLWHLAVCGGRVSGGEFVTHLTANYPSALDWAVSKMREHERGLQSEG